jgi:DNA-binding NarL/FixJ family response regulator
LLLRRSLGAELVAKPFSPQHLALLERSACGESSVSLARDLGVSQAAVCELLKRLVRRIGLRSRTELLWFCRERTGLGPPNTLRAARLRSAGGEFVVLGAAMQPSEVSVPLTRAERSILLELFDGKTNSAIARSRRTAVSTVANQVMALRDKLGAAAALLNLGAAGLGAPPPAAAPLHADCDCASVRRTRPRTLVIAARI